MFTRLLGSFKFIFFKVYSPPIIKSSDYPLFKIFIFYTDKKTHYKKTTWYGKGHISSIKKNQSMKEFKTLRLVTEELEALS